MANDCDAVVIGIATGLPYRGNPVIGGVGELAPMK